MRRMYREQHDVFTLHHRDEQNYGQIRRATFSRGMYLLRRGQSSAANEAAYNCSVRERSSVK